jgi:SNF2 family DNA or RNA helicase
MGSMLKKHLEDTFGGEVPFLHGRTPKKQRDRMAERFQQEVDGPRFFVLSLKAGGLGLNLTAANHRSTSTAGGTRRVEDQATDRTFRIG